MPKKPTPRNVKSNQSDIKSQPPPEAPEVEPAPESANRPVAGAPATSDAQGAQQVDGSSPATPTVGFKEQGVETIQFGDKLYSARFRNPIFDHTEEERDALRDDLEKRGEVLSDVVMTDQDEILDGYHRLKYASELGITKVTFKVITGLSDEEKVALVHDLNVRRRQFDPRRKQLLVEQRLRDHPEHGDELIASWAGVAHATVGGARARLINAGEIKRVEKTLGKDGKWRKTTSKASAAKIKTESRKNGNGSQVPAIQPPGNTTTTAKPTAETSNAVPAIDNKSDAKAATDETPGEIVTEHSQTAPQAANHPAPGTKNDATEQPKPALTKPGLKTAVLDAGGVFVAVRSAVTRIVNLLGTESGRQADRESISKFADDLDQLARKLRDALTPPEADKDAPGVGG